MFHATRPLQVCYVACLEILPLQQIWLKKVEEHHAVTEIASDRWGSLLKVGMISKLDSTLKLGRIVWDRV